MCLACPVESYNREKKCSWKLIFTKHAKFTDMQDMSGYVLTVVQATRRLRNILYNMNIFIAF